MQLSIDGMTDGEANIRDREQVLEHYLKKVIGVYDSLYTVIENNVPMNLGQLVKGQGLAVWTEALPVLQVLRLFGDGHADGRWKWRFIGMSSSKVTIT